MRVQFILFLSAVSALFLFQCSSDLKDIPLKNCVSYSGMPGPEDLVLDRGAGILYVSSHERRIKEQDGKLFYLDLNSPNSKPSILETNYPKNFRPHGMSLLNRDGKYRLYVISHIAEYKEHSVEVFERTEAPKGNSKIGKWTHIQTIKDPTITSPNDLFVVSENEIFVSNDHGPGGYLKYLFQDMFGIKGAEIAYFDGKSWSSIGNPISLGNGIIFVKRQEGEEYLYRSSIGDKSVLKFPVTRIDGRVRLGEPKSIVLGSGPDNLEIDEKGIIFVATHPSIMKFLSHVRNKENHSPTKVIKILPDDSFQEIYSNSGEQISAGSTALTYKEKIYIAQVFEDFILQCQY